jgi:hypothetical protein
MPEATKAATILIATSHQAHIRAKQGDEKTMLCNCTVVIVFAAFFIEANLTHIIEQMGLENRMKRFFKPRGDLENFHPGLQQKLGWFYNYFVAQSKATAKEGVNKEEFKEELERSFPGFYKIYEFRNKISHGGIDASIANVRNAEILRVQAKAIVNELFEIAAKHGPPISRTIPYEIAIASE